MLPFYMLVTTDLELYFWYINVDVIPKVGDI